MTLAIFFEIIRVFLNHDEITTSVLPISSAARIFSGWSIMAVPGENLPPGPSSHRLQPYPSGKITALLPRPAFSRPAHLRWTALFTLIEWTANTSPVCKLVQFLCRKEFPERPDRDRTLWTAPRVPRMSLKNLGFRSRMLSSSAFFCWGWPSRI